MRTTAIVGTVLTVAAAVLGTPASGFAQTTHAAQAPQVRRVTAEEAVKLALENNLGIQVAQITPRVEDLSIASARGAWAPTVNTTLQTASTEAPSNSFLSGAQGTSISDARFLTNVGVQQSLPWGGRISRVSTMRIRAWLASVTYTTVSRGTAWPGNVFCPSW